MNTDVLNTADYGRLPMQRDVRADTALSGRVIAAAFEVSNHLGTGFLEKVYERALVEELGQLGLMVRAQPKLPVQYKGKVIATYIADLVVEDSVLVELKCVDALRDEHVAQCLNYLKATGLSLCLLLNFQRPRLEWKRIAL